jgi:site-specific recombinase XerD
MSNPCFNHYPLVTQYSSAQDWLQIQANLCLASNTIEAYGQALNDYFYFCICSEIAPEIATKGNIAAYVRHLTERHNPRRKNRQNGTNKGLANATIQQRLTVVRLYYEYLIEEGLCNKNPASKGRYTAKRGFGGQRSRNLIPHYKKLPWIPNEEQWQAILQAAQAEPLRNRLMLAFAYDGALRREEVCSLQISDINPAEQLLHIRAEVAKNNRERFVPYSEVTSKLFALYLPHRRQLSCSPGPLFLSESRRNRGQPISIWTWSKVVERIAERSHVCEFTTHTLRHLRLTDLARDGMDLNFIAQFAGHRNIQTTQVYIHLSGRELANAFKHGMNTIHTRRIRMMEEAL